MRSEIKPFLTKKTINCKGDLLDLSTPKVMGILNITPDSFYDGGKYNELKDIVTRAKKFLIEGAAILDIGGYSSRPGATDISAKEERERVLPVISAIKEKFPDAKISIDTFRAEVASAAIKEGAAIINDISGGNSDPEMYDVVAETTAPYILMHMQGTPQNMQKNPQYENVTDEIIRFFSDRIATLKSKGISDIIIDPGFGFGKTVDHNFRILRQLQLFKILELPVLAGVSRKSMINKVLGINPSSALNGTTVINTIALLNGANILRVHDVKEAAEAVKLTDFYRL